MRAFQSSGDIDEERRLLKRQMGILQDQCEKLEDLHRTMVVKSNGELDDKELHALQNREKLLLGELAEAEAVAATAVRQRHFAEESRIKQAKADAGRIAELELWLSNARIDKATAEARARQGESDLARIA